MRLILLTLSKHTSASCVSCGGRRRRRPYGTYTPRYDKLLHNIVHLLFLYPHHSLYESYELGIWDHCHLPLHYPAPNMQFVSLTTPYNSHHIEDVHNHAPFLSPYLSCIPVGVALADVAQGV